MQALAAPGTSGMRTTDTARIVRLRHSQRESHDCFVAAARLHPGITQEIAPNESQRDPEPLTSEALFYDWLFVARWV